MNKQLNKNKMEEVIGGKEVPKDPPPPPTLIPNLSLALVCESTNQERNKQ